MYKKLNNLLTNVNLEVIIIIMVDSYILNFCASVGYA